MHSLIQNLRHGARLLWSARAFSATALAALALGMGAATAIFSVVDAVLLKPLPFRDPGRLAMLWERNAAEKGEDMFVAGGNFLAWQRQSRSLEALAAVQEVHLNLTGGPGGQMEPEELTAERVSAGLFPLLGRKPEVGSVLSAADDRPGSAAVVLGFHLWQRRFGGDPGLVGKTLRLRGQSYTVRGVMPSGFSVLNPAAELWIPLALDASDARVRNGRDLGVIARLRAGVTFEQARAEMETIGSRLESDAPALNRGWRPWLVPLEDELNGHAWRPLAVLAGAVGLLLLIACVNVANLLLARGAGRRKELAIRAALGASRGRLVTQLMSESVLLALAGGALGLLLAHGGVLLLQRLGTASLPRLAEARLDGRLFLFALGAALVTGVLFGATPALAASGARLNRALAEGGRSGTTGRQGRRLRNALVVTEVALAVVVMIAAGLLVRSFERLRATDAGFRPEGVLTFRLPLAGGRNAARERRIAFVGEVVERVASLPGVRAAGATNGLPLTGTGLGATVTVEGRPAPPPEQRPICLARSVTPAYFRAMGIPLVAGRELAERDTAQAAPVVLVNRTLARRFFRGGSPLGARLTLHEAVPRSVEIVGVVGDVKPERMEGAEWPTVYFPWTQAPVGVAVVAVAGGGAPEAMAGAVRRAVGELDREQPVADLRPMDSVVNHAVAGARFNTVVLAIFAQIAFVLAAVGIYGVIAGDVAARTRELGIRMAMGAGRREVLVLVLGQGARLAGLGIAIGLVTAAVLTRLMSSMLYGVKPADAGTFAGMAALLGVVALAASWLPARRAMSLDPVAALRQE